MSKSLTLKTTFVVHGTRIGLILRGKGSLGVWVLYGVQEDGFGVLGGG